jgi:oligoribonuclease (3'-5' exoribonuclease)
MTSKVAMRIGSKYEPGPNQLVFIDFETNGLESHSVPLEIGVAVFNPNTPLVDEQHAATFQAFIDAPHQAWFPGVADQQALDLHNASGFRSDWEVVGVQNRLPRSEVGTALIDFLGDARVPYKTGIPCGFAVTFDMIHLARLSWKAYQYLHHRPIGVSALNWPIRLWINQAFRPSGDPTNPTPAEHRALPDSFAAARALFWMRDNIYTARPNWFSDA